MNCVAFRFICADQCLCNPQNTQNSHFACNDYSRLVYFAVLLGLLMNLGQQIACFIIRHWIKPGFISGLICPKPMRFAIASLLTTQLTFVRIEWRSSFSFHRFRRRLVKFTGTRVWERLKITPQKFELGKFLIFVGYYSMRIVSL